MTELIDFLYCPIKKEKIDIGLCQDIQMVSDEAMKESILYFNLSDNDKIICLNCKKRIDPAL